MVRADANAQIGIGHVMLCLALAQAWQGTGGQVLFVLAMEAPALEARLKSEGIEVTCLSVRTGKPDDAIQTADLARQMEAAWTVLDGYHFGADYQRIIKESGLRLLAIDDNGHADHYYADVVLNQNIHAHKHLYRNREPYTQLLLGTDYVLLRREFLRWRGWKRQLPEVGRRVLVTLGGGDPDNVTLKVIRALQQIDVDSLEAVVVVGGSNPHYGELRDAVQDSKLAIRVEKCATDMPPLMAWADIAVSAGGSTCWELAFMGVPSAILVLARNQERVVQMLAQRDSFLSLGQAPDARVESIAQVLTTLALDRQMRQTLEGNGRLLVDGLGASRVAESLTKIWFRKGIG